MRVLPQTFWLAVLWAAAGVAAGQTSTSEDFSFRSASGQFLVRSIRRPPGPVPPAATAAKLDLVRLTPTLMPVSGERIKQALWRELGISGAWQGKIQLAIYPGAAADEPVRCYAERFRDAWQYRLELPDLVDRTRYVRGMVQVLLLEYANRGAVARSAEIPAWLVEGMTRDLLASGEGQLVIAPPPSSPGPVAFTPTMVSRVRENPLERAHQELSGQRSLTFHELSWPTPEQLDGDAAPLYSGSAQLLLNQLLAFEDGRDCLKSMLRRLPDYLNWQLAFLQGFQGHFQRPLDIEKWWAVRLAAFTGRELSQMWSLEQSWVQLEDVLHPPIDVRASAGELPRRSRAALQTVIRDLNQGRQRTILGEVLRRLDTLRPRVAEPLVPLVDEYRQTLGRYLAEHDQVGSRIPFRAKAVQRNFRDETLRRLDALETRRALENPAPRLASEAQAAHSGAGNPP